MQENYKYPWVWNRGKGTYRQCKAYMAIFKSTGIIPMRCRHYCWKVVIRLDCYVDLLRLKTYLKDYPRIAKCGFDRRDYTDDTYIGFIYCDSKDDAENTFFDVLQDIPWAKHISYARGCTEMRMEVPVETWDDVEPKELTSNPDYKWKQFHNRRMEVLESWEQWEGEPL